VSGTDPAGHAPPAREVEGLPRAIGTWKRAYALVLLVLAVDIVVLWMLGRVFG
jgi:hypothetical protein